MPLPSKPIIIALDLEGTLISNAVSQIVRPGLSAFLEYCRVNFERIVIFTAVSQPHFRKIASTLVDLKEVPTWFADLEYIEWEGRYKDISFIPRAVDSRVILIDDRQAFIKPGQESNWLQIREYQYPYSSKDRELARIVKQLSSIQTRSIATPNPDNPNVLKS